MLQNIDLSLRALEENKSRFSGNILLHITVISSQLPNCKCNYNLEKLHPCISWL